MTVAVARHPAAARRPGPPSERRRRLLAAVAVAAVAAAGCATPGGPAAPPSPPGFGPVAGRFALAIVDPGAAPRRSNARFETEGDERTGRLSLLTPIGTTLAEARWAPGSVTLTTTDGSRRFDSLEALSQDLLGERLPLQALVHWLRGRPWPGAAHAPRTDGPPGFEQLGWRIDLSSLRDGGLSASRAAPAPAVDLRVRLDPPSP